MELSYFLSVNNAHVPLLLVEKELPGKFATNELDFLLTFSDGYSIRYKGVLRLIPFPIFLNAKIAYRLVFAAPILEYVELSEYLKSGQIEQVSVGGESCAGAGICDFDFPQTGSIFVKDGALYHIRHCDEHSQARKGMIYLKDSDKEREL